jgi:hypothetical protein
MFSFLEASIELNIANNFTISRCMGNPKSDFERRWESYPMISKFFEICSSLFIKSQCPISNDKLLGKGLEKTCDE